MKLFSAHLGGKLFAVQLRPGFISHCQPPTSAQKISEIWDLPGMLSAKGSGKSEKSIVFR